MRYVYVHRYMLQISESEHELTVCLYVCLNDMCTQTFTVLHISCMLVTSNTETWNEHER